MGFAVLVLASLSAMLSVGVVLMGMVVGFFFAIPVPYLHEFLLLLPRLTWVVDVPGTIVAALAAGGAGGAFWLWTKTPGFRRQTYLLPPDGRLSWSLFLGGVFLSYLATVEMIVVVATVVSSLVGEHWSEVVLLLGILIVAIFTLLFARENRADLYEQLTHDCRPASEAYPELVSLTRKLALQADVFEPTVCVVDRTRPESFTIRSGRDATIILSTGLLDVLSTAETRAVLAHEVSHLANGDSRIIGLSLIPVLVADDWINSDSTDLSDLPFNLLMRLFRGYGKLGVAVLSRGREWSADAGAVALTGSPATLASALVRLDETRGTPRTDLREWERRMTALDILPPTDLPTFGGLFRMHPDTGARIDRLRRLAANGEYAAGRETE